MGVPDELRGSRLVRRELGQLRSEMPAHREKWGKALSELEAGTLHATIRNREDYPDNHPAETATATVDREIDYTLEENAEQVLGEIEAALERIDEGRYGSCEDCGGPVGEERLQALPWARLCIDDARKRSR